MRPHSLLVFNIPITVNAFCGIGLGFAFALGSVVPALGGGLMSGPCFGGTFGSGGRFNPSALACGGGFIGSGGLVDPDAIPLPVDLAWDEASRLVLGFGGGGNFGTGTPGGIDNRALALACSAAISALASASLKLLTSNGALLALANVFGFGVVWL